MPMIETLVDTCVWLDLAKDYRQQPVIGAVADLIEAREMELIAPETVLDEFERNKARVIEDSRRSLRCRYGAARQRAAVTAQNSGQNRN